MTITVNDLLAALEERGLLLLQDRALPSVVTLVAGGPVSGSWWGHEKGDQIFRLASAVEDDADVTTAKLIGGKVTFVHRRLWRALFAVGRARGDWQTRKLGDEARALLEVVERGGWTRASGPAAKLLETRLLCASRQVHTDAGRHALELARWTVFAREAGEPLGRMSATRGQAALEEAIAGLCAGTGATAKVGWKREAIG